MTGRNESDTPGAFPEVAFARRAGLISRGSACAYSPKGDLPKAGLRGWLAFAGGSGPAFAACGVGFYFPKGGLR